MNKIFLTLISLLFVFNSYSQIVNIEQQRIMIDSNGFAGGINLMFLNTKDKGDKLELISGFNFSIKHNRHLFLNYTTYNVGKLEGYNYTNNFFIHNRYNYNFYKEIYTGELFVQFMMNDFLDVDNRTLYGGGLRIRLINKDKLSLHFGLIYMYEYERLINNTTETCIRSSDYLSLVYKITNNIQLFNAIYYQPKVNKISDYRLFNSIALEIQVSNKLYFSILFNILYDEYPAPGIDNITHLTQNKLSFKF